MSNEELLSLVEEAVNFQYAGDNCCCGGLPCGSFEEDPGEQRRLQFQSLVEAARLRAALLGALGLSI